MDRSEAHLINYLCVLALNDPNRPGLISAVVVTGAIMRSDINPELNPTPLTPRHANEGTKGHERSTPRGRIGSGIQPGMDGAESRLIYDPRTDVISMRQDDVTVLIPNSDGFHHGPQRVKGSDHPVGTQVKKPFRRWIQENIVPLERQDRDGPMDFIGKGSRTHFFSALDAESMINKPAVLWYQVE